MARKAGFRIIRWDADKLISRLDRAVADGIDMTTAAAVTHAQTLAPRDTGFMATTIESRPAQRKGGRMTGQWGNWTALYTLWQEIGARGRSGRYFLRRAADAQYPLLVKRIREAVKWR